MNRVLLPSLAAVAVMLSVAPAFALTTKDDVVSACTQQAIITQPLRLQTKIWGTTKPSSPNIEIDPVTGLPVVKTPTMDLSDLTPVLPSHNAEHSGYRVHLAETGGTPSASDTCKTAIASYVQGTGKLGADLDKLLGELAYELIGKVTGGNSKLVETALEAIATNVSDESAKLKQFIQQKASEAAAGSVQKPKNAMSPANPSGQ